MFSQTCVPHSVQLGGGGGGGATNASCDRSHGHGEVVLSRGRWSCPGGGGPVHGEGASIPRHSPPPPLPGHPPAPGQDQPSPPDRTTTPLDRTTPPGIGPPPPPRKETSFTFPPTHTYGHYGLCEGGRYASYWNAFLFHIRFTLMLGRGSKLYSDHVHRMHNLMALLCQLL